MQNDSGVDRPLADVVARASASDQPQTDMSRLALLLDKQLRHRVAEWRMPVAGARDHAAPHAPCGVNRLFFGRASVDPMALPHAAPAGDMEDEASAREADKGEAWAQVVELLQAVCQGHEALLAIVDFNAIGMFVFDLDAHLVFANRYGEQMLEASDELQVGGGKLSATRPDNIARISQLFARMAVAKMHGVGMTRIERSGLSPYVMVLTRCMLGCNEALVALVSDGDQRVAVAGDMLRELYGLGRAEAEIAGALARGMDLEAIAEQRSTSIGTVRNQVKSIAAKMDCTRQIDIVRRILSIPIIWPVDDPERN